MLKKVLIANRGEIAVRIIRSCREQDIPTVALYSAADRVAPHVLMADEAVCIGPPPARESYLNTERILQAAADCRADAVHPGYGFLSENAAFARAVTAAGMTWIGPAPEVLEQMGDKVAARRLAEQAQVPCIPGSPDPIADPVTATRLAREIGYPVLIKAAGGGGGKGMRRVDEDDQFASAFERARSEAANAFADDRVYLEKYVQGPHHVEVQVFADTHGNVVSLGERECSIQRRYQKVIEETPSPFITADVRQTLMDLAVRITRACNYTGAGTVEFLVDAQQNYYFLEMNTRLQVEHPLTELVTGLDLVAGQLRVASGEPLGFSQADIRPRGHAIECRIYAEDGFGNFAPSTGTVLEFSPPDGFGVRFDHGIRAGQEITPYYDALLGKLCTWGRTRGEALARMTRALEETRIIGVRTTVPVCKAIMNESDFANGNYTTAYLADHMDRLIAASAGELPQLEQVAAIGAALFTAAEMPSQQKLSRSDGQSSWLKLGRERQLRS